MKVYNQEKTQELNREKLDFEKGYLKSDKILIARHEAVEYRAAVYKDRPVREESGGISVYKDLVTPEIEAKEAWDEYEDIQIFVPYTEEEIKTRKLSELRSRREKECFPVVNRGQFWYDSLTAEEREELKAWYVAWLNVTETFVVPDKPAWLTKAVTFVKPEVESNVRDCVGFY